MYFRSYIYPALGEGGGLLYLYYDSKICHCRLDGHQQFARKMQINESYLMQPPTRHEILGLTPLKMKQLQNWKF